MTVQTIDPTKPNFIDLLRQSAAIPSAAPDTLAPPSDASNTVDSSSRPTLQIRDPEESKPPIIPGINDAQTADSSSAQPPQTDESVDPTSSIISSMAASAQKPTLDSGNFLTRLGRYASGFFGLSDNTPQAQRGAEIADITGRLGRGLAVAEGTPEQKQIAEEQNEMPLKVAQLRALSAYRTGELANRANANDIRYETQFDPNSAEGQKAAAAGLVGGARAENLGANTAKTQYELEILKQGQFPVDPVTANLVGRPDLANKAVSPLLWKSFQNVLNARGLHAVDLGADGYWNLDRAGNKINQISSVSPSVARAQAYGQYRPVEVINPDTGNAEYQYAGSAINSGATPMSEGAKIMSKDAQFKDIYSGIGSMRQAINGISQEPLDADTIAKLTMATRETDPTIAHQLFDTILGSQRLTPAQQDFVVAFQQLNERMLSVRNLAGMGNASDSMRAAVRATLPSAKSGDVSLMRKQLDSVTNLVDNLYSGVPNIKRNTPNAIPSFSQWKQKQAPTGAQ